MPSPRRFPPPWTLDEANNACFIVRDSIGQALWLFLFRGRTGAVAKQTNNATTLGQVDRGFYRSISFH